VTLRVGAALLGAALCLASLGARPGAAESGDPWRGARLFAERQCTRCHRPAGRAGAGPALESLRRPQGAYELAGRLWNHVPGMFTALVQDGLAWPAIGVGEMADLMAYLGASPERDPAPDLLRGQIALLQKGCLKCHSFRREGGTVGPDLAARRDVFAPAHVWAAAMWRHTPQMAAAALARGIPYPRFSGAEMVNLTGFLRGGEWVP
jgi:hypothetical protein